MESGASKRSNACSPTCVTIPKNFVPIPGKSTKNPKSGQADEHSLRPHAPKDVLNSPIVAAHPILGQRYGRICSLAPLGLRPYNHVTAVDIWPPADCGSVPDYDPPECDNCKQPSPAVRISWVLSVRLTAGLYANLHNQFPSQPRPLARLYPGRGCSRIFPEKRILPPCGLTGICVYDAYVYTLELLLALALTLIWS